MYTSIKNLGAKQIPLCNFPPPVYGSNMELITFSVFVCECN